MTTKAEQVIIDLKELAEDPTNSLGDRQVVLVERFLNRTREPAPVTASSPMVPPASSKRVWYAIAALTVIIGVDLWLSHGSVLMQYLPA